MVCRAPTSATTCSGTVTGQQLQYDAERRLAHWQSSPSSPTSSADFLYDSSGQRVEQVDTSGGTSSRVYYLFGGAEEVSSSGANSTLTTYYNSAGGLLIGENVGGTISYLASDGLGSVSEALSTSGTVTAAQLYGPYGALRYASGTMPTAKGFTGQRADASTSGLEYYGARYYDPVIGQFASADTKQGPNRFAYVAGNPETLTDPTGHRKDCSEGDCGGGGGGGSGGGGGGSCHSDASCGCYSSCGGDGTPPPPSPAPPPPVQNGTCHSDASCGGYGGCDMQCQLAVEHDVRQDAQKTARSDAQNTADTFSTISQWLGWVQWILGGVTALLAADAIFGGNPAAGYWAVRLGFLTWAIHGLIDMANNLSKLFSSEAAHDASWFSETNIDAYLGQMWTYMGQSGVGDIAESFGLVVAFAKWGSKALNITMSGLTSVALDAVGSVGLFVYAQNSENQQVADLAGTCPSDVTVC